jgi:hypothetical protein
MRVTFPRLADHERGYAVIERDDGVTYRMWGGSVGHRLPHDVVHFVVEDQLALADGIWGAIAAGVVYRSMEHIGGRRPPHAAERSAAIKREYGAALRWAEFLGGFVEHAAHSGIDRPDALARLPRQHFGTLEEIGIDPAVILAGARALRARQAEWAALPGGGKLCLDWPSWRRLRPPAALGRPPRRVPARRRAA